MHSRKKRSFLTLIILFIIPLFLTYCSSDSPTSELQTPTKQVVALCVDDTPDEVTEDEKKLYNYARTAWNDQSEQLKVLLDNGVCPNFIQSRRTPLHAAASLAKQVHPTLPKTLVEMLIKAGADPNKRDEYNRKTPLHVAAYVGYLDIVKMLIEAGADPTITNTAGQTPLQYAETKTGSNRTDEVVSVINWLKSLND